MAKINGKLIKEVKIEVDRNELFKGLLSELNMSDLCYDAPNSYYELVPPDEKGQAYLIYMEDTSYHGSSNYIEKSRTPLTEEEYECRKALEVIKNYIGHKKEV